MKRIRKYKKAPDAIIIQGFDLRLSMIHDKLDAGEIIISYLTSHPTLSIEFLTMIKNKYPELTNIFEKYSLLI